MAGWRRALALGRGLLAARAGRRRPLFVDWGLTKRCNLRCAYCGSYEEQLAELDEAGCRARLAELRRAGARRLSFSGGEPLLVPWLGALVERAAELDLAPSLASNGLLVPARLAELRRLARLDLTLDGPPAVQDPVRGPGSAAAALAAAEAARSAGIAVGLLATLSAANLDSIDWLLRTAAELRAGVLFQPVLDQRLGTGELHELVLDRPAYQAAVDGLIERRRAGAREVANSVSGLAHLRSFPRGPQLGCAGGRVACRIEPDGRVTHCERVRRPAPVTARDFATAFLALPPIACRTCFAAARVETNLAARLDRSALRTAAGSRHMPDRR